MLRHTTRRRNTERETKALYIFYFLLLFFFFNFHFHFSFFLKIRIVDLSCNIELGSLYIKLHLCLNLSGIWKYFWNPFYSVLITVSMNLFDQLVIVTCDSIMEG